MVAPAYIAIDPRYAEGGKEGLLFWTDPDLDGGVVMRAWVDGSGVVRRTQPHRAARSQHAITAPAFAPADHPCLGAVPPLLTRVTTVQRRLLYLSTPAGIAVDSGRQALYMTQSVRGASVIASSYTGLQSKHVTRYLYYEPRAVGVDPTDGAVFVVEADSFEPGCDPTTDGGLGAVLCNTRSVGRVSRITCAWEARASPPPQKKTHTRRSLSRHTVSLPCRTRRVQRSTA